MKYIEYSKLLNFPMASNFTGVTYMSGTAIVKYVSRNLNDMYVSVKIPLHKLR